MELASTGQAGPPVHDVCEAVRSGAAELGHRPAVTVLHPAARYEQSGASLANWAAKGAHLLQLDHAVAAGDTVGLLAPACWTSASAALATWWLGAIVDLSGAGTVSLVHQHRSAPQGAGAVLRLGDALDGGPQGGCSDPVWTHEAQPMPDHPPSAAGEAHAPALRIDGRLLSQEDLLRVATSLPEGTAGVEEGRTDPVTALVAVALRPLVTGHATVVLRGVDRDTAAPERVRTWC
ncbi:MAG: hypothetical protein WD638_02795 [Nitriliruptoraceae bacterium]